MRNIVFGRATFDAETSAMIPLASAFFDILKNPWGDVVTKFASAAS